MELQPMPIKNHVKTILQKRPGTRLGWSLLMCSLTVLLSACLGSQPQENNTSQQPVSTLPSPTPSTTAPTATPTPPTITLKVVNCPAGLTVNWDSLVGAKEGVNKVQTVTCGYLLGNGVYQALVNVRYYTPDARLDFYVFDNIFDAPVQKLRLRGLLNGDAKISPVNTIMTAQVSPSDTVKGAPDVFKEYKWNPSTGAFGQVLFPGIFPHATYYQAEQAQAQLNTELAAGDKRNLWKTQFYGVVEQLAKRLFHWTDISRDTVHYRSSTGSFVAQITNLGAGGGGFIASMFHLDGVETNMFVVMQVTSLDGTSVISSPTIGQEVTAPAKVNGTTLARGSTLGHVVLYNDLFISVGDSGPITSTTESGSVTFNKSIDFKVMPGIQEGIVVFYATYQNNVAIINQVNMVKVFFSA